MLAPSTLRRDEPPDSGTLYCIASLSKAFMIASLDLLVQEGKVLWESTIHSVIPEFQHAQQPAEYSGMTVRDICSHCTGLLGLDEITQGLDGRILIDKKDAVKVCRAIPSKHGLRSNFLYNNGLFELAGHLVERVSGYSDLGDFQNASGGFEPRAWRGLLPWVVPSQDTRRAWLDFPKQDPRVCHLGFRFTVPSPLRPPGGCPWIHLQHLHHPRQQLGRRRSL